MKQETRKLKIKTQKGRIITLSISNEDKTHLFGTDKYGDYTVVPKNEIESCVPIRGEQHE